MSVFRKWVLAISLFVALVLEGVCSFYLHQFMTYGNYGAFSVILPISIMLIGLFDDTNENEIWLALGTGIIADIYFYGIIGIYTVFLPLSCWAGQKIARFLPEIFWARLIVVLISLLVNLGWTILFFVLLYWIWGNLAQDYPFLIDLNAYRV